MRKSTKILLAILCAGVLLTGVGTGMAFATYASFDYDTTTLKPEVNLETKKVKKSIPVSGPIEVYCYWEGEHTFTDVVYDESVPKDEAWLTLKHDPVYTSVEVDVQEGMSADGDGAVINIYPVYLVDDFDIFMQQKDVILEGLKNGVLIESNGGDVFEVDVEVRVNPANEDRLVCPY